jgi:trans-2,3-dihydro-3-hydroxyanthranilate isomerase
MHHGWPRALARVGGQGCYLYGLDPVDPSAVAYARFFNPTVGIWEDPATGSAAGPLVSRLAAQGVVGDGATVVVEQGHAMGRPGRIRVLVSGERIRIGGASVVVAEGTAHHLGAAPTAPSMHHDRGSSR